MQLLSRYVLHVLSGIALAFGASPPAQAAQTNVAVAANFTDAANEIARAFKAKTGHEAILSFGSTGQFYTQITQDAPFEVFLAADDERPTKAVDEGFAVPGSQFTYAIGKLVLWSKDPDLVQGEATLKSGDFTKISIANPEAAPYGAAAVQAMTGARRVRPARAQDRAGQQHHPGLPVRQTGNAELGFVALAQVAERPTKGRAGTCRRPVRPDQAGRRAAQEGRGQRGRSGFLEFLQGPEAEAIIARFGYGLAASS